jgi:hypothetical protein
MTPTQTRRRKTDPDESEAHVHRRKSDSDAILHMHNRLNDCEESIKLLLESNRDTAELLKSLTGELGRVAEVLEAWNNAKGFILTLKLISGGVKIIVPIVAFVVVVWVFIKTGKWIASAG